MIDDALSAAELLALEARGDDGWRSVRNQDNRAGAVFGGQPLCQALSAAQATVPEWPAHNLSALFLRSGRVDLPIDYAVERVRDGRRFAARRVLASQEGRPIFDLLCSFHAPEEGLSHQIGDIADIAAPETLVDLADFAAARGEALPAALRRSLGLPFPVELRLVDPDALFRQPLDVRVRDYWFRMPSATAIEDPLAHQCLLAFASDYWLAGTASAGHHGGGRGVSVASLNHSLWFHAPVDLGEWLLYRTDSPWAGAGRGLARGLIYDRAGRLVASSAQEIRLRIA